MASLAPAWSPPEAAEAWQPPEVSETSWTPPEAMDAPAETIEGELQTPLETFARAAAQAPGQSAMSALSGVSRMRQAATDFVVSKLPEAVQPAARTLAGFDPTGISLAGPLANDIAAESERVYEPDRQTNPKAAAIGAGVGQALPMAATAIVAGPAGPLALGAAQGADQGIEQAEEMGITDPAAKLAMGGAYAGIETLTEKMGGFGSKALTAPIKRTLGQAVKEAGKTVLSESIEEPIAGAAQDFTASQFAPESYDASSLSPFTVEGGLNPAWLQRRELETIGGAAGGLIGAGVQALASSQAPAPEQSDLNTDPLAAAAAQMPPPQPVAGGIDPGPIPGPVAPATTNPFDQFDETPSPETALTPQPPQTITGSNAQTGAEMPVQSPVAQAQAETGGAQVAVPPFRDPDELAPAPVGPGNVFIDMPKTPEALAAQRADEEKLAQIRGKAAMIAQQRDKPPVIPDAPYGGYDVLDFVNENIIHVPAQEDRTGGEYDWTETADIPPQYNKFLFHGKRGKAIDKVAQMAYEGNLISDPTPDALLAAIESTIQSRDTYTAETAKREAALSEEEQATTEQEQSWADSVIAGSMETPFIGIDPRLMAAYTVKGAQLIKEGFTTFAKWSREMISRFGEKVREYLQGAWQAAMKTSEQGFLGTGLIPKARTSVAQEASRPMAGRPMILSGSEGEGVGNGWNYERQMSGNAVTALERGKLMEPDFKVWLAEYLGVPEKAITRSVIRAGNQKAQNIFREYHHVGKNRDTVEFYDPEMVAASPKFLLGVASELKIPSHQAKAKSKALEAWQGLREQLTADGDLGTWTFAEEATNKGGILDKLSPTFKEEVGAGRMSVQQAVQADFAQILDKQESRYQHLVGQNEKVVADLEAKLASGQGKQSTPRQIEDAKNRIRNVRAKVDAETAKLLEQHPANKMSGPVSRPGQVESSAKPESAVAPTRAEDVRMAARATEATSGSSETSAQAQPPVNSGFKNLDTSGTTAGFLNADIINEGVDLIRRGFNNFADWSRAMITRFGQRIRDYLQGVWQAAMKTSEQGFVAGGTDPGRPGPMDRATTDIRLTHEAEAERMAAEGKEPLPTGGQFTVEGATAEARARVQQPGAAGALVSDIIDKQRTASPVEHYMMMHYAAALDAELDRVNRTLADPASTPEARSAAAETKRVTDEERARAAVAQQLAGSAAGAALGARSRGMSREVPSLAKMIADISLIIDPTGQTLLPAATRDAIEQTHGQMTQAEQQLNQHAQAGGRQAYNEELQKLLKEAREEIETQKAQLEAQEHAINVQPTRVRLYTKSKDKLKEWSADGKAARDELLKMIGVRTNMSFGVEMIPQLARMVRGFLSDGFLTADAVAKKLVKAVPPEFYNSMKKFLPQIMDAADKLQRDELKKTTSTDVKARARKQFKGGEGNADIAKIARQLALAHIVDHLERNDTTMSAAKIADLVRDDLQEFQPGITPREARDLISGYGQSSQPSKDAALKTLRDYKAQLQKITQLEALRNLEALKKTGPQRDKPSAELRELQKQVEALKRELGYQSRSREDELKSARDRIQSTLENQIEDLQRVLAGKQRPTAPRERVVYDAELQALQTLRNHLRELVAQMPEHKAMAEARRNKAALKAAQASEAEWNRRAKAQEWKRPGRPPMAFTDEVNAARTKAKEARANFEALKKASDPRNDPEAVALRQFKARVKSQIDQLRARIRSGDFEPKPRTPRQVKHDAESEKLRHELAMTRREWQDMKVKYRIASMGWGGRGVELVRKLYHLARSIKAGGEFSGVLNQGMIPMVTHPLLTFGSIPKMFKAFLNPQHETSIIESLWMRPNGINGRYKRHRLAIHDPMDYSEMQAEGNYRSAWGNKIPFFAGSGRAYTTFLNHMRADLFDHLVDKLETRKARRGETVTDRELDMIAEEVNDSTGHGKLGFGKREISGSAKDLLGVGIFSPSFVASRARYLAGASMWKGSRDSRALIAQERIRAMAGFAALYALALALQGDDDEPINATDARDATFMKVKFGKTYVDLLAGLQQMAVFTWRLFKGETAKEGKVTDLTDPNGRKNRLDLIMQFAKSKRSPSVEFIDTMFLSRKDYSGKPLSREEAAMNLVTPMTWESINDIIEAERPSVAAPLSGLAVFGLRTDTREAKR